VYQCVHVASLFLCYLPSPAAARHWHVGHVGHLGHLGPSVASVVEHALCGVLLLCVNRGGCLYVLRGRVQGHVLHLLDQRANLQRHVTPARTRANRRQVRCPTPSPPPLQCCAGLATAAPARVPSVPGLCCACLLCWKRWCVWPLFGCVRFLTFLKAQVENIKVGHPLEEGVKMGPLVCRSQYEKVRASLAPLVPWAAALPLNPLLHLPPPPPRPAPSSPLPGRVLLSVAAPMKRASRRPPPRLLVNARRRNGPRERTLSWVRVCRQPCALGAGGCVCVSHFVGGAGRSCGTSRRGRPKGRLCSPAPLDPPPSPAGASHRPPDDCHSLHAGCLCFLCCFVPAGAGALGAEASARWAAHGLLVLCCGRVVVNTLLSVWQGVLEVWRSVPAHPSW
jgi:hypothetical protein